ncbi:bacterial transcriptional activator domain-containing protein [Streptomyces sp. L7]
MRLDTEEFVRRASAADRSRARREQDRAESVRCHEAAAALYTGDLLEDTPYTDWAVPERERLAAIHLDLLEGLAGLYLEDGAYPPCVETCRRLLARDPCREEAHRLLMRAFVRQNQPHRAAAQFETLRRELDGTLGMTPDPETRRLYESVRRHRAVRDGPTAGRAAGRCVPGRRRSGHRCPSPGARCRPRSGGG